MKYLILLPLIFLSACSTVRMDKAYNFSNRALDLFKSELIIDQTTVHDVRRIFGEPHLKSINEASSVELPKVPILDRFNYIPKETWTYFRPKSDDLLNQTDILKVMGVGLLAKDFQMVSIFFNENGRVVGYIVNRHSIK